MDMKPELVVWGDQSIEEWVEGGTQITTIHPDGTRETQFIADEE